MLYEFTPFTAEAFKKQTGLNAHEHEGVYLRWVNVNLNYQNYITMKNLNEQFREVVSLLKTYKLQD
ncbi:MAG TPA: hypothetical protein VGD17_01780 [Chitinophagaceae bacterium]